MFDPIKPAPPVTRTRLFCMVTSVGQLGERVMISAGCQSPLPTTASRPMVLAVVVLHGIYLMCEEWKICGQRLIGGGIGNSPIDPGSTPLEMRILSVGF